MLMSVACPLVSGGFQGLSRDERTGIYMGIDACILELCKQLRA